MSVVRRRLVGRHTDRRFFEESAGEINWLPRISLAPESSCNVVSSAERISYTSCTRRRKQTEEFEERGGGKRKEGGGGSSG